MSKYVCTYEIQCVYRARSHESVLLRFSRQLVTHIYAYEIPCKYNTRGYKYVYIYAISCVYRARALESVLPRFSRQLATCWEIDLGTVLTSRHCCVLCNGTFQTLIHKCDNHDTFMCAKRLICEYGMLHSNV